MQVLCVGVWPNTSAHANQLQKFVRTCTKSSPEVVAIWGRNRNFHELAGMLRSVNINVNDFDNCWLSGNYQYLKN